jgi:hypothetical protein
MSLPVRNVRMWVLFAAAACSQTALSPASITCGKVTCRYPVS